ncbi:MAG: hypothetical protein WBZ29_10330 [Methanocella sp.]
MGERKKPESGNSGAHEQRAEGEITESKKERDLMRRADIAGEVYNIPEYSEERHAKGKKDLEASEKQRSSKENR